MKLSTRSRYACRALAALARIGSGGRPVQIRELAADQDLPADYLAQLLGFLRSGGLVHTRRGTSGGIALTRRPEEVTVAEVVRLTEGSLSPVDCVEHPEKCPRSARCAAREVWVEVKHALEATLARRTLADLARREQELAAGAPMYYI